MILKTHIVLSVSEKRNTYWQLVITFLMQTLTLYFDFQVFTAFLYGMSDKDIVVCIV